MSGLESGLGLAGSSVLEHENTSGLAFEQVHWNIASWEHLSTSSADHTQGFSYGSHDGKTQNRLVGRWWSTAEHEMSHKQLSTASHRKWNTVSQSLSCKMSHMKLSTVSHKMLSTPAGMKCCKLAHKMCCTAAHIQCCRQSHTQFCILVHSLRGQAQHGLPRLG